MNASGPPSWRVSTRSFRIARRWKSPTITHLWSGLRHPHPFHIPGYQITYGQEWERGGIGGHYRAIMDDHGKVQVAICFNMDLGDAWEWADAPEYPEKYAGLAFRLGVNYVLYTMTH
jgi:hypothetical protein